MGYYVTCAVASFIIAFTCGANAVYESDKEKPNEFLGKNLVMGAWVFAMIAVACLVVAGITHTKTQPPMQEVSDNGEGQIPQHE